MILNKHVQSTVVALIAVRLAVFQLGIVVWKSATDLHTELRARF